MPREVYMTCAQVAEAIGVNAKTVRRWAARLDVPIVGQTYCWTESDCDRLLAALEGRDVVRVSWRDDEEDRCGAAVAFREDDE